MAGLSTRAAAHAIALLVTDAAKTPNHAMTGNEFSGATVSIIHPGKELRGEVMEWVVFITRRNGQVLRVSVTDAS